MLCIPNFFSQRRQQFPDLIPTAVGSGYAGIASGRVLNAKHATALRSSQQSSRQVWDRVARAANASSSSSLFPPLAAPSSSVTLGGVHTIATTTTTTTGGFRKPVRQTPWASGSGSGASGGGSAGVVSTPTSIPSGARSPQKKGKEGSTNAKRPPALSSSAFPELPTTGQQRIKPVVSGNTSLRNILGEVTPVTPAWRANGGGGGGGGETQGGSGHATPDTGKGKKSKGKQKQTLFTLGSFPA